MELIRCTCESGHLLDVAVSQPSSCSSSYSGAGEPVSWQFIIRGLGACWLASHTLCMQILQGKPVPDAQFKSQDLRCSRPEVPPTVDSHLIHLYTVMVRGSARGFLLTNEDQGATVQSCDPSAIVNVSTGRAPTLPWSMKFAY